MMFILYAILLFLGARNSIAQRPSNASTCDYYAQALYGANTSTTQNQLIQGIVALAFGGGFNLSNVSSDITGILNPGTFQNLSVDLRPWFNGSIDSTNLNNQPVGIDWLDDGGTDPLYDYLSNQTSTVILTNTTNEYRLFNHFFLAFAHIFGCTLPPPPLPSNGGGSSGPLSLAYVHKYMNLNFTDLGHFIDQLTQSAIHFGFSEQDGETFNTQMNSLYNVRCAPPITLNPAQGPQLLSLCQASSCPLAEPNPDCAAYVNLTAAGVGGGTLPSSSAGSGPSSTSSASSSTGPASSATSSSATTQTATAVPASTSSSPSLSTGGIAGIAVGGAAGLLIVLYAVYIFGRRHRRRSNTPPPSSNHPSHAPTDGTAGMAEYNPNNRPETTLYAPSTVTNTTPKDPHMSYASNAGGTTTIAEMDSPRFRSSPQMGGATSPHHSVQQTGYSSRTMSPVHHQQPAELEGAGGGGGGGGFADEQQQYYQQQQYSQQQQQQQQMGDWNRVGPDTIANQGQRYG